jgi:peptidoglycan/LPS O-acetylase OafA/YrhL
MAQWLPGYLPWFSIGLTFAVVSVTNTTRPELSRWRLLDRLGHDLVGCWLVAAALFAMACTPLAGPRLLTPPTGWEAFFKVVLYGGTAAFVMIPLVFGPERHGYVRTWASSPLMVWIGDISYGIFCLHLIVLEGVFSFFEVPLFQGRFAFVFTLTLAGTIIAAALSFYWVERPLLRLKNAGPFASRQAANKETPLSAKNWAGKE